MPKFIAHALVGAGIVTILHPKADLKNWFPITLGALIAISPDFDFGLNWLFSLSEIHRGVTHSILFSMLVSLIICLTIGSGRPREALAFSCSYLSHLLMDFFTSTTGGIKMFYPFSDDYYNFGLTSIFELPLGSDPAAVSRWVLVETVCFLPILIVLLIFKHYKKKRNYQA